MPPACSCRPSVNTLNRLAPTSTGLTLKLFLSASALLFCGACAPTQPLIPIPAPLPARQAIALYNTNVQNIPSFSAAIKEWEIKLTNDGKTEHHHGKGRKIVYRQPATATGRPLFFMQAKIVLENAFEVGSNETEFWTHIKQLKQLHWGRYIHAGKPCARAAGLNPDLFLDFAGLRTIGPQTPASGYQLYKVEPEHNIIQYMLPTEQGLQLQREIVISRRTNLPVRISSYDQTGQIIMQSTLGQYQSVGSARLPGDILIAWPAVDSFLRLKLRKFRIDTKTEIRTPLFQRPGPRPGIEDYQQIDIQCE